jgi:hypothetical protein
MLSTAQCGHLNWEQRKCLQPVMCFVQQLRMHLESKTAADDKQTNSPKAVFGSVRKLSSAVLTESIRSCEQACWALRITYTTAGVVRGAQGVAPVVSCV